MPLQAVNTYEHHEGIIRGATRAERNMHRTLTGGGNTALAGALLDHVQPESLDNSVATASCIGITLGLLDDWMTGGGVWQARDNMAVVDVGGRHRLVVYRWHPTGSTHPTRSPAPTPCTCAPCVH